MSFGDSLSDVGTYAPATSLAGDGSAPYFGGRFTTNGPGAAVWVELLAAELGLAITPAEVGFAGPPGQPASVAVAVLVEGQPGASEQTGGQVAAPIARAVMETVLAAQGAGA